MSWPSIYFSLSAYSVLLVLRFPIIFLLFCPLPTVAAVFRACLLLCTHGSSELSFCDAELLPLTAQPAPARDADPLEGILASLKQLRIGSMRQFEDSFSSVDVRNWFRIAGPGFVHRLDDVFDREWPTGAEVHLASLEDRASPAGMLRQCLNYLNVEGSVSTCLYVGARLMAAM